MRVEVSYDEEEIQTLQSEFRRVSAARSGKKGEGGPYNLLFLLG